MFSKPNASEFDFHAIYDALIVDPLRFLGQHGFAFDVGREVLKPPGHSHASPDDDTFKYFRPDVSGQHEHLLMFKGEEKKGGAMEIPEKELVSKMQHPDEKLRTGRWSSVYFGQLPYVFCYAAAGRQVRCYAITCDLTLHPLTATLDISLFADALKVYSASP